MSKILYQSYELLIKKEREQYWDACVKFYRNDTGDENYNPTEQEFEEYLRWDNEIWYEEIKNELEHLMEGKKYKVKADLGLWYGRREGTRICEGFEAISVCIMNGDYIRIYEERGTLKIDELHHDGTNHYTIKEITTKGLRSPKLYDKMFGSE